MDWAGLVGVERPVPTGSAIEVFRLLEPLPPVGGTTEAQSSEEGMMTISSLAARSAAHWSAWAQRDVAVRS